MPSSDPPREPDMNTTKLTMTKSTIVPNTGFRIVNILCGIFVLELTVWGVKVEGGVRNEVYVGRLRDSTENLLFREMSLEGVYV